MGICIGETRQDRLKMKTLMVSLVVLGLSAADFVGLDAEQLAGAGRQDDGAVQGGIDFSGCTEDAETGLCCVEKEEEVTTLKKEPILECTHKNVEQCHYTYVAKFKPSQEQVCEENCEKVLQTRGEGLQWSGSRNLPDSLRVSLQHQVCGEAARQVCWRYCLREASS